MTKDSLHKEIYAVISHLAKTANLAKGSVIVIGASTSEVDGMHIGQNSVPEIGEYIASSIIEICKEFSFKPVFQCCEHLNRALVMEKETCLSLGLTMVNVCPKPKAGGSVPTAGYALFSEPVVAQYIQADAAVDIGNTLVGMHIRPVAVPVRMPLNEQIGNASVVLAYSRLPYIGGPRASYN